jgi:hypothetical protein
MIVRGMETNRIPKHIIAYMHMGRDILKDSEVMA